MPPKKQLPAPIDRPLSRAYLREFTGLSTAYPPGISDPTSLRVMENIQINRDGSARVRPGLRYLSYESLDPGEVEPPPVDSARMYLPFEGTPPVNPNFGTVWDQTGAAIRRPLLAAPNGVFPASTVWTTFLPTGTTLADHLGYQWVSDVLPAKTIGGQLKFVMPYCQAGTTMDAFAQLVVRVVSGDGLTERGVLYSGLADTAASASSSASNYELFVAAASPTAGRTRIFDVPMSNVVALAGDRIVVEAGARCILPNGTSRTYTMFPSAYTTPPDSALAVDQQSDNVRPWIEFSEDPWEPPWVPPATAVLGAITKEIVGTHEPFFLNDGSKAYLFAVRESDNTVGFRVYGNGSGYHVQSLAEAGFTTIGASPNFSSGTTYVKYLQIDNKIFALSNNGEAMRYFTVGEQKTVKKLASIERPAWSVADKLTVVHPDAGWVNNTTPVSTRTNLAHQPNAIVTSGWADGPNSKTTQSTTLSHLGAFSYRIESTPQKTNLCTRPLDSAGTVVATGWNSSFLSPTISVVSNALRVALAAGTAGRQYFVRGPDADVTAGQAYQVHLDWTAQTAVNATAVVRFRWYDSGGGIISEVDRNITATPGRRSAASTTAPAGAVLLGVLIGATTSSTAASNFNFNNVLVAEASVASTMFSGLTGTNYFWTGTADASTSVYHPPATVSAKLLIDPTTISSHILSMYVRPTTARLTNLDLNYLDSSGSTYTLLDASTPSASVLGTWTRYSHTNSATTGSVKAEIGVKIQAVPRGEYHYFDSVLFETGSTLSAYFDGSTADTATNKYSWVGTANNSRSQEKVFSAGSSIPPAETKTANTLIDSTAADNVYNFGFFYTFSNEVGESAPSQVSVVRTQRSWAAWRWETPNAAGEPSGTTTNDPEAAADQLVAYMPQAVHDAALDQGAIGWNLYMFTWSDQDPVPVSAVRVAQRDLTGVVSYGANGWLRATPQMADAGDEIAPLPKVNNLRNYSDPSKGGQGLVASDRMVMVNDPTAQAVIKWTSNQQGNYTDFSAARGGGYKTLTSGNLYIPACVKLWQNPQSVDTLTILCMGLDGMSTGYYMAPAQVASQSEATNIMGFEETTATPGTVSPYGVEVLNNALYHPIDEMVMKSTANNYNISHKSITEQIQNLWIGIASKHRVVSSQHDNRIYYLVHNPLGEDLEPNCWGNEVWVFDAQAETGTWSRWLTQGKSLRKIEQGGKVVMSLVRPDGIFYFDEAASTDEYVVGTTILTRSIPWKLETNTQGANRAHDANAHLQQANITLGYFQGVMRYGIRGLDIHGKRVDISKLTRDAGAPSTEAWDLEDFLLIRRDMREWFFYAESVEEDGVVLPSSGQISLVQFRYTPVSVNTGYEFGSIESFEYQRAGQPVSARTTDNGVPMPFVDTARP